MARSKNTAALRSQIEAMRQELAELEKKDAERIGSLAIKAGLGELVISDKELLEAFKELRARFQK